MIAYWAQYGSVVENKIEEIPFNQLIVASE